MKHIFSGVPDQVTAYIANLKKLCDALHRESSASCLVTVCRVLDDVEKMNRALENLRKSILWLSDTRSSPLKIYLA